MSTTLGAPFFSIHIILSATIWVRATSKAVSRLKVLWRNAEWMTSSKLLGNFCNKCRAASLIWFDRAQFITSLNFYNVVQLKCRCSLMNSKWRRGVCAYKWKVTSDCNVFPPARSELCSIRVYHCARHRDRVLTKFLRLHHPLWSSRRWNSATQL